MAADPYATVAAGELERTTAPLAWIVDGLFLEAAPHDVERVLSGVEEHPTTLRHRETTQAWCAGGHRDGQVEGKKRLAASCRVPGCAASMGVRERLSCRPLAPTASRRGIITGCRGTPIRPHAA